MWRSRAAHCSCAAFAWDVAVRAALETTMRRISVLALILATAMPTAAFAHGVVGDYIFLEPLITQDPTPANELDILAPSWVRSSDANTYSIAFSVEKVLWIDDNYMPRFSIGGGSFWHHQSPYHGQNLDGFSNLT